MAGARDATEPGCEASYFGEAAAAVRYARMLILARPHRELLFFLLLILFFLISALIYLSWYVLVSKSCLFASDDLARDAPRSLGLEFRALRVQRTSSAIPFTQPCG